MSAARPPSAGGSLPRLAGEGAPPATLLSTVGGAPINILIVDDEPKNLTVLQTVLDLPGYRIVPAASADQALLALVAEEFALLILDIRMPGMTGFELAQMVKGRKKTAHIPIIFLTAYYSEDQHVLEGYGSGAVDYLQKPINAPVLRAKVAVFAELHRKSREVEISNRALLAEVTERHKAERRLEELNENLDRLVTERTRALKQLESELRETDRRKDEFIATLAHELRNPLAPVRYAVQILRRDGDAAGAERARDIIARQVQVMARLVDDLMDVSRINRGHIELKRTLIDLSSVIEHAVEASRAYIDEGGHELVIVLPEQAVLLDADATRLAQVFVNLLGNAAKYTDRGGRIELAAECDESEVRVTVRDDGIGIPADRLHGVFAMFSQVSGSASRSRGGLGIGLSLVKHLVELHGGQIEARSGGPGKGSEFVVTLSLHAAQWRDEAQGGLAVDASVPPEPGSRLRILVVDDHVDGAATLSELLALLGHEVRVVHDGEAAGVEAAWFQPQAMLLDIGLPGLDGYEVCRRARREPWGKQITIVALTGWGDKEAQRKSKAAGFDSHLVKPVDEALLVEALAAGRRAGLAPHPGVAVPDGTGLKAT
jgi:signal transduction histidine kinase